MLWSILGFQQLKINSEKFSYRKFECVNQSKTVIALDPTNLFLMLKFMTESFFSKMDNKEAYSLQLQKRRRFDWREGVAQVMPPIFPTLMFSLFVSAVLIGDYFLLEVFSVSLCSVGATKWLSKNRSKRAWIPKLINKTTERLCWIIYSAVAVFSLISPAVAAPANGNGAGCAATNTILGPIADALIGVFQGAKQVGTTGTVSDSICQVFTTFAAIIALMIVGSAIWGLFDNQGRGSDLGKAFAPLGVVLAGVVIARIGIKLVMGV